MSLTTKPCRAMYSCSLMVARERCICCSDSSKGETPQSRRRRTVNSTGEPFADKHTHMHRKVTRS